MDIVSEPLTLEILNKSNPSSPAEGYGDRGRLYRGTTEIIWEQDNKVSACPNATNPHTGQPWDSCYAMIAYGTYDGEVINDKVAGHGICIVLNNHGAVPARLVNLSPLTDHFGKLIATGVLVHKGQEVSGKWCRGSAACITISPDVYDSLFSLLPVGTKLQVVVRHNGD